MLFLHIRGSSSQHLLLQASHDYPQICIIAFSSVLSVYAHKGGAAHRFDLQPAQVPQLTELNFVSQAFQVMSVAMGKVSVALLIYRLQPPTQWRTWLLGFLSTSSLIIAVLVIIIFFVQCRPTSALWRPGTGTCWDQKATNDWIVAAGSESNGTVVTPSRPLS